MEQTLISSGSSEGTDATILHWQCCNKLLQKGQSMTVRTKVPIQPDVLRFNTFNCWDLSILWILYEPCLIQLTKILNLHPLDILNLNCTEGNQSCGGFPWLWMNTISCPLCAISQVVSKVNGTKKRIKGAKDIYFLLHWLQHEKDRYNIALMPVSS